MFHSVQDDGAPPLHQAISSREISCGQAQCELGSPHPILLHQYLGQEIEMYGAHCQESNRNWAPFLQYKQGWGFLPEQVMEVSHSNPEGIKEGPH